MTVARLIHRLLIVDYDSTNKPKDEAKGVGESRTIEFYRDGVDGTEERARGKMTQRTRCSGELCKQRVGGKSVN
jgi:hypothetical protein